MFPDPTLKWRPFPSIIDGIKHPPFVLDVGLWKGVLHLIVIEGNGPRAYGVQITAEIYAGFDERIYSMANHGDGRSAYDGNVYIKEAEGSAAVTAYTNADYNHLRPRHFLFIGTDRCYEALSFGEPVIRQFDTREEAYRWGLDRSE